MKRYASHIGASGDGQASIANRYRFLLLSNAPGGIME